MYLCCMEAATVACSATRAPQVQPPHSKYFSCALRINLKQHTGNLRATEEPLGKFPLVFLAWQYTSYCWWITLDCFVFVLRRLMTHYTHVNTILLFMSSGWIQRACKNWSWKPRPRYTVEKGTGESNIKTYQTACPSHQGNLFLLLHVPVQLWDLL